MYLSLWRVPSTSRAAGVQEVQPVSWWGWYCEWNCLQSKRHIGQYYNMLFKKFYYLNGSLLYQQELVLPEPVMFVRDRRKDRPAQDSAQVVGVAFRGAG